MTEKETKIRMFEQGVEDCERRVGQFILQGGELDSEYVNRQKVLICMYYDRLFEAYKMED